MKKEMSLPFSKVLCTMPSNSWLLKRQALTWKGRVQLRGR